MNIAAQAELDLSFTLEDSENGFGISFTLVDPDKNEYEMTGQTTDIGFFIDPGTGIGVNDRQAEIIFRLSSFVSAGGSAYPNNATGWFIKNVSVNGIETSTDYSIKMGPVDRKLGIMKLICGVASVKNG